MNKADQMVRTRFAPSPTGYLHVGGARTALFSWLYAKRHGGVFVLRIEDTDFERSTEASIEAIINGLTWLGIDHDEGPHFQSKRMGRYREVIEQLLGDHNAYRCYCSKERLTKLRETQLKNKQKPRYDGHCRDLDEQPADQPYVVRFRNPEHGDVIFSDLIRGTISISNDELDDVVLMRSDGVPTYNFTVVIDDWDMKITHVIRGDDHINNTPRQINILHALGAELPQYAHVPMILGSDGKRLSKRHGAVSVLQYQEEGYLSEALLNYLVRLGWAHGNQEIFSRQEMIALFDLTAVSHSPAALDSEKLDWLNQHYMKTLKPESIEAAFIKQLQALGLDIAHGPDAKRVIALQAERCKTLQEMAERSRYFYQDIMEYDEKAARKNLKPEIATQLRTVHEQFAELNDWEKDPIHQIIINVAEQADLKLGKLAQPIRVAVTGGTVSPPIDATLELIGRDHTLSRLQQAIAHCQQQGSV